MSRNNVPLQLRPGKWIAPNREVISAEVYDDERVRTLQSIRCARFSVFSTISSVNFRFARHSEETRYRVWSNSGLRFRRTNDTATRAMRNNESNAGLKSPFSAGAICADPARFRLKHRSSYPFVNRLKNRNKLNEDVYSRNPFRPQFKPQRNAT